jgi:hypothetical protein
VRGYRGRGIGRGGGRGIGRGGGIGRNGGRAGPGATGLEGYDGSVVG